MNYTLFKIAAFGALLILLSFVSAATHRPVQSAAASESLPTPTPVLGPPARMDRGNFRIVLNGFRVNNESDDDILEGDGKGDEVFITSDAWMFEPNGTYRHLSSLRSQIMGDRNNYSYRIMAGSRSPQGGLQTGDSYPSPQPWTRTGTGRPRADRPPMLLWEGELVSGRDIVVVVPIVWEWDSNDVSNSQKKIEQGLPYWYESTKDRFPQELRLKRQRPVNFFGGNAGDTPATDSPLLYPERWDLQGQCFMPASIKINGKGGTRPIGYVQCGDNSRPSGQEIFRPNGLFLTYEWALRYSNNLFFGTPGVFEIRYVDSNDHGDYSLFLQIERTS